jgi:nucleoside-diphosphate-sugar epimerase
MAKKKAKTLRKAPRARKKPSSRVAKPGKGKKKAAPAGSRRTSPGRTSPTRKKNRAAPVRPPAKRGKAALSEAKGGRRPQKRAVRKKATLTRKIPFSKALKEEISTVLVTGASGCVGSFLVQNLLRAGYSVVAADTRGMEPVATPEKRSLVLKRGDLANPVFAATCLEGVDAIFHAGAHADGKPLYGSPEPSPVNATRTLYRQARDRRVKRIILITSASLYGRHHGPVAEDGPLEVRDEFEQTLSEMERVVLEGVLPGLPSVTVIRPAPVYGPGCTALMACLATLPPLVKTLGPRYIPLSGGPRTNLVHGDDVARAAVFLLLHPKAYGGVFNVADNDPMPFGHFLNVAMESYGLKALGPGVSYPPSTLLQSVLPCVQEDEIFNPLGKLSNLLWTRIVRTHRLSKTLIPRIDQQAMSVGTRDLVTDNRKLLGLGFRLKYPRFRKGWENTLSWYLKKRWIPGPEEL